MNLKQIVAPAALAVSLDEAKDHLRVDHDAENDLITALIQAATAWLDGWSGVLCIALEAQTLELTLDAFPSGCIRLPIGPTTAISSVKYLSADGEQTLDAAKYSVDLDSKEARIQPVGGWPSTDGAMNSVRIRFVAGEGTPPTMKHVIKLLVGHWYENREAVGGSMASVPMAVDMLVAPLRRIGV